MAYLDDFCDNTLTFLQQNVVYIAIQSETCGLVEAVVEQRNPVMALNNIDAGEINGVVAGSVYKLRPKKDTDARSLAIYFCGYTQNKTIPLMLGNDADFMFTPTMDGCTFGVGSQAGTGDVRVAHANNGRMANPMLTVGGDSGRAAQKRVQAMMATSYIGPGGFLIEPDNYMGANLDMKATTFGYHDNGGDWTFKSLAYRFGGGQALHGGVINFP